MQQHTANITTAFFTTPKWNLLSNIRDLYYYSDKNGTNFNLHIFVYYIELNASFYIFSMIVFIAFEPVIIK